MHCSKFTVLAVNMIGSKPWRPDYSQVTEEWVVIRIIAKTSFVFYAIQVSARLLNFDLFTMQLERIKVMVAFCFFKLEVHTVKEASVIRSRAGGRLEKRVGE